MKNSKMLKGILAVSVFVCVVALEANLDNNYSHLAQDIAAEPHKVITSDSYILTVFRLRNLKNNVKKNQHPVLMIHGLLQSSDRFIQHGRNLSLAYDLVDAGFDVWLGNNRGNKYSRHHVYLNPDDPEDKFKFFNYTFEEIGVYDVAATVDYILIETKTERLHYIGHSQGGSVFFALNTLRPIYNEKFITANLLAGAGYQKHFADPLLEALSVWADNIYEYLLSMGLVEFFPSKSAVLLSNKSTIDGLVNHCLSTSKLENLCRMLHSSEVLGTQGIQSNSLFPGGGAVKTLIIFGQNVRLKRFCRWDYGEKRNEQIYGASDPPIFNLSLVTVNTTLHFGMGDALVNFKDVMDMAHDMPNVRTRKVDRADFDHSDFTDGLDAKELVYNNIIEALLYFERDIKWDIIEEKTPFYLSIVNITNPFTKNYSKPFASIKSDSSITYISSLTTSIPYSNITDIFHSSTKNVSNLSNADYLHSLINNISDSLSTNISLDSINTTFSNTLETNDSLNKIISETIQSNVSHYMTTTIPDSSSTNVLDTLTENISNPSQANDLNSLTLNISKSSPTIDLNSLAINNPDLLMKSGLNSAQKKTNTSTNVWDSFIRNNSESLPISISATSTKSYINTTLLITGILLLKIV